MTDFFFSFKKNKKKLGYIIKLMSRIFQISQFGQNKKGIITRNCKERYTHTNIPCGVIECMDCNKSRYNLKGLSIMNEYICVVDHTAILNQLAFLENSFVKNVVICQSLLKVIKEIDEYAYRRIKYCVDDNKKYFYEFDNEFHRGTVFPKLLTSPTNDVLKEGFFFFLICI
jgi:hypothetical protein